MTATARGLAADVHTIWEDEAIPALVHYGTLPCLSPAFDPEWEAAGHLAAAARLLADWSGARAVEGIRAEVRAPRGRTPIVVVEAPATNGARGTVLVYGHLDKQPPLGAWREGLGPYRPVRDGTLLYGRGMGDDGYAAFAAGAAIEALDAQGIARPRVVVLLEASEESGSPDLPGHLDDLAGVLERPELVICLDSGCLGYDRLWLTTSLRGNLLATVRVQVLDEGVHSGSAGGVVPTSFRLLRQLLDRVEDPATGEVLVPELHGSGPPGAADTQDVAWEARRVFPAVPGLAFLGDSEADRLQRRSWAPSMTLIGIDGVPAVADAGNVLRPFTTARLSFRLPPDVDPSAAEAALAATLSADPPEGADVAVETEAAAGWASPALATWAADAFARASQEVFGRAPGQLGEGGTIPFLSMLGTRWPGVPLVATGVLGPGSNAHGPNECLHLPMAEAVTVATARLVEAAADPGGLGASSS